MLATIVRLGSFKMPNVIYLKKPPEAVRPHDLTASPASPSALPTYALEIRERLAGVKEEVRITILMLDLAVAQARRVAETTQDTQIKKAVEHHLASIEGLLEIARQKANTL